MQHISKISDGTVFGIFFFLIGVVGIGVLIALAKSGKGQKEASLNKKEHDEEQEERRENGGGERTNPTKNTVFVDPLQK